MAHPSSNHAVDITTAYDRKLAAILAHRSQHEDPDALVAPLREAFAANAAAAGMGAGRFAEAFFVVPTG
jgi:LmbE family N-acetylglucosaminyl deacetylase